MLQHSIWINKVVLTPTNLVPGFLLIKIDSGLTTETCRFISHCLVRGLCCHYVPLRTLLCLEFPFSLSIGWCRAANRCLQKKSCQSRVAESLGCGMRQYLGANTGSVRDGFRALVLSCKNKAIGLLDDLKKIKHVKHLVPFLAHDDF